MGTDNLFWKRKRNNDNLKRKVGTRGDDKDLFLIVCEGGKTEPNYFKKFKVTSAEVRIIGTGKNTVSLVKSVIDMVKKERSYGIYYDQVWIVFDKDSFPIRNFNRATQLAEENGMQVAYSNESFELWYLLHFNYYDSALNRNDCMKKLTELLGCEYRKNDETMYEKLLDKQNIAIKFAERLLSSYPTHNPGSNKPSTTVYLLVQELNKFC